MLENLKRIKLRSTITYVLIPLFLLGVWVVLSLFFNNRFSFSVLTYPQPRNDIISIPSEKLLKGQKIQGEFVARQNYLGLVVVKFNSHVKYDFNGEDLLNFSIKEKGKPDWYHINSFRAGILRNQVFFPFGFPVIADSKGKTYVFEIESLFGDEKNAVVLDAQKPDLLTGYQIPKSEITASKKAMLNFILEKGFTSFTSSDFFLSSLIYLIPFLVYVFGTSKLVKVTLFRKIYTVFFSGLLLFEIFFLKDVNIGLLLILILGWLYVIQLYKVKSKVNFYVAFILLFIWVIVIPFGLESIQSKLNLWVYTFFIIGLIQSVIEERQSYKNTLSFHTLIHRFKKK